MKIEPLNELQKQKIISYGFDPNDFVSIDGEIYDKNLIEQIKKEKKQKDIDLTKHKEKINKLIKTYSIDLKKFHANYYITKKAKHKANITYNSKLAKNRKTQNFQFYNLNGLAPLRSFDNLNSDKFNVLGLHLNNNSFFRYISIWNYDYNTLRFGCYFDSEIWNLFVKLSKKYNKRFDSFYKNSLEKGYNVLSHQGISGLGCILHKKLGNFLNVLIKHYYNGTFLPITELTYFDNLDEIKDYKNTFHKTVYFKYTNKIIVELNFSFENNKYETYEEIYNDDYKFNDKSALFYLYKTIFGVLDDNNATAFAKILTYNKMMKWLYIVNPDMYINFLKEFRNGIDKIYKIKLKKIIENDKKYIKDFFIFHGIPDIDKIENYAFLYGCIFWKLKNKVKFKTFYNLIKKAYKYIGFTKNSNVIDFISTIYATYFLLDELYTQSKTLPLNKLKFNLSGYIFKQDLIKELNKLKDRKDLYYLPITKTYKINNTFIRLFTHNYTKYLNIGGRYYEIGKTYKFYKKGIIYGSYLRYKKTDNTFTKQEAISILENIIPYDKAVRVINKMFNSAYFVKNEKTIYNNKYILDLDSPFIWEKIVDVPFDNSFEKEFKLAKKLNKIDNIDIKKFEKYYWEIFRKVFILFPHKPIFSINTDYTKNKPFFELTIPSKEYYNNVFKIQKRGNYDYLIIDYINDNVYRKIGYFKYDGKSKFYARLNKRIIKHINKALYNEINGKSSTLKNVSYLLNRQYIDYKNCKLIDGLKNLNKLLNMYNKIDNNAFIFSINLLITTYISLIQKILNNYRSLFGKLKLSIDKNTINDICNKIFNSDITLNIKQANTKNTGSVQHKHSRNIVTVSDVKNITLHLYFNTNGSNKTFIHTISNQLTIPKSLYDKLPDDVKYRIVTKKKSNDYYIIKNTSFKTLQKINLTTMVELFDKLLTFLTIDKNKILNGEFNTNIILPTAKDVDLFYQQYELSIPENLLYTKLKNAYDIIYKTIKKDLEKKKCNGKHKWEYLKVDYTKITNDRVLAKINRKESLIKTKITNENYKVKNVKSLLKTLRSKN